MRFGNKKTFVVACGALILVGSFLWVYFKTVKHGAKEERLTTYLGLSEERLTTYLGLPAKEVVEDMNLADAEWYWVNEPPGILRGVCYYPVEGTSVTLYIDDQEPLYRKVGAEGKRDYEAFLQCRVGGIQYDSNGAHFDVGADVPWQFRHP